MIVLSVYAVFLIVLGYIEYRRHQSIEGFLVADRKASSLVVGNSIIASCVGGSATIGMVGLSYKVGMPAIWWLLSGACGLVVLGIFLAQKVRQSNALTMPEILEYYIGKKARIIASLIIVIAWSAILAAQFSAGARIISSIANISFSSSLFVSAFVIVLYSILGGQASVLKSDIYQYVVVMAAFLGVCLWFVMVKDFSFASIRFELLNGDFGFDTWRYYMLILGGSYVVCPMLFGRLLSAKDEKSAMKGMWIAVTGLAVSSFVIVLTGLMAKEYLPANLPSDTILTQEIFQMLPPTLGLILLLGLLSAIISSADSCLITAASVFCNDLIHTKSLRHYRLFTAIFGILALILTFHGKSILGLLLAANDIYVSGIVAPIFIAMVMHQKGKINEPIAIVSMITGGLLGLTATLTDIKIYSMLGVVLSCLLCVLAFYKHSTAAEPSLVSTKIKD